jgi:hypothetical protein
MNNPLENIENRKAQQDLGVFAFRVYEGARGEGASLLEAFIVTAAYFKGLIGWGVDSQEDDAA